MTLILNDIFEQANGSRLKDMIGKISAGYSVRLAVNLLEAYAQPYKRVIEDVRIDHGECRRQLTIDWQLPTIADALPDQEHVEDQRFISAFADLGSDLVVPLLPLRRDYMMSDFSVAGPDGVQLYICGQDESVHQIQLVLRTLWQWVDEAVTASSDVKILEQAKEDFLALPSMPAADARRTAASMKQRLENARVPIPADLRDRVLLVGHYVAKYHIIWVRLPKQPGDGVRLSLSCRTRFAADYTPLRGGAKGLGKYHFLRRAVDCVRRIAGQEPYRFAVPVWMSALCRSYHFQMPAPPSMYFVSQRFTLEKNLHQSGEEQQVAFKEHYKVNGAYVSGKDEAGGPVAHLYARDLPATADNSLYAYARVRERPPGSTALVMWLGLLTAGFMWIYYALWTWLATSDTKGIDLASLSVALLGVAAIWFSNAFREDVKTRVPLVSRLGLLLVGVSTIYSLLAILVQRVTCTAEPNKPIVCSSSMSNVFSRWGLLMFAILVSLVVVWLVFRRFSFHREYRKLQVAAIQRYMS